MKMPPQQLTRPFGAVTITGSRVNSLLLRRVSAEQDSTTEWETARATNLPWVKDLTVAETIILRNEAANALPRFRAKMSHAFSESGAARDGEIKKLVAELHDEALEVEQEIRCADPAAEKRFQSVVGSVSIVAAVFGAGALGGGITAGAAAGAAAGLASILGHIHKGNREPHRELQRNQSRPGFVLLKSKELLGHASSGP